MRTPFLLFVAALALPATANVEVEINGKQWSYSQLPRLSTVIAPVALDKEWYWPATALFSLSDATAETQRQAVLAQIDALKADASPELAQALARLTDSITGWQLATRVDISIDYDLIRLNQQNNPGFDSGEYKLELSTRPDTVFFWGAVDQPMTLPHAGATAVAEYLPAVSRSDVADSGYVLVIAPDGQISTVGVAAWNKQPTELMPGASVYIPFAGGLLTSDLAKLNHDIAGLARHRVK